MKKNKNKKSFVDGFLAHNYDPIYVEKLLEGGKLSSQQLAYILNNANKVILNLRAENAKKIEFATWIIEVDKKSLVARGKRK